MLTICYLDETQFCRLQSDWHDNKKMTWQNDLTWISTNLTLLKNSDLKSCSHHRTDPITSTLSNKWLEIQPFDSSWSYWLTGRLKNDQNNVTDATTWNGITTWPNALTKQITNRETKDDMTHFFATTWIIFADDKYWPNTYYTYIGPVTDILDTLIIHDLFARERVAFVLIICISTNTCDFRDFLRILYFLIFSCLLLKKNHHTVPICAVDCKILLHYEKSVPPLFVL